MRYQLLWSIGLYSIDIAIIEDDIMAETPYALPVDFVKGMVSEFVESELGHSCRLDGGIFRIYAGLQGRDPNYAAKMVTEVSNKFEYRQIQIDNVDDVKVGGKTVVSLIKAFNDGKNRL